MNFKEYQNKLRTLLKKYPYREPYHSECNEAGFAVRHFVFSLY